MKKLLISILLVNLLAACASERQKETVAESKPAPVSFLPKTSASAVSPVASRVPVTPVTIDQLNNSNSILAKRSVFYPLDVSVVQDDDKTILEAHAKYLSENINRKVRLEGNCDERGSGEYNLALGQRRADGVKKMLLVGGVKDSQIETVSFGNEKPKGACHEEKCWKENRRSDLDYDVR